MEFITIVDIIIIILFLFFVFRGYERGFIDQTSRIIGLLIALYIAITQYQVLQVYLEPYIDMPPQIIHFISFVIIFILFNIAVNILGLILKQIVKFLFLNPLDHLAGAFLGFVKGAVLIYLLLFILNEFPYQMLTEMLEESYIASQMLQFTPVIQQNLDKIFGHS